ncbi:hypothetical protein J1605_019954 [Eschrichtius robustus]|uniref:Uncharacterized protein n=1 Tax=Eschrichtius robustus TaxID=9764 RepID=A0AB34HMB4_ESCRO|nr:hypothetical protein J1605_019954 [Eschrichtius robustus]
MTKKKVSEGTLPVSSFSLLGDLTSRISPPALCILSAGGGQSLLLPRCWVPWPDLSMLEYDTENLNSEEIYSSLRGVTEAIEKFSFRSQEDLNEPIKRDGRKDCEVVSTRAANRAVHQ